MTAKDTARRLRAALEDVIGQHISHTEALEIVARLEGYRDLHELQKREAAQMAQLAPSPAPSIPAKLEFTEEDREILAALSRRDRPVADFEEPRFGVVTQYVDVPGVGVAHRNGGAGVNVMRTAKDTACSMCGTPIRVGELCTRSADRAGTVGGLRFTRCQTCQPLTITLRDPEAIRLERRVRLSVDLTFNTRENAVIFFRLIANDTQEYHPFFQQLVRGEDIAQAFGVRLPDMPALN